MEVESELDGLTDGCTEGWTDGSVEVVTVCQQVKSPKHKG